MRGRGKGRTTPREGTLLQRLLHKHGLSAPAAVAATDDAALLDAALLMLPPPRSTDDEAGCDRCARTAAMLRDLAGGLAPQPQPQVAQSAVRWLVAALPCAPEAASAALSAWLQRRPPLSEALCDAVLAALLAPLAAAPAAAAAAASAAALQGAIACRATPLPRGAPLRTQVQAALAAALGRNCCAPAVLDAAAELAASCGASATAAAQQQRPLPSTADLIAHAVSALLLQQQQQPSDEAAAASLRRSALACLQAFASAHPQLLYPHWPRLIPPASPTAAATATPPARTTVFSMLARDSSPRVRVAAADFLSAVIRAAKPYFVAVTPLQPLPRTFTAFTHTLGATLVAIHAALLEALGVPDQQSVALAATLKCLSLLVSTAPFDKLGPHLLGSALECAVKHVSSRELAVRSAALECASSVFNAQPPAPLRHLGPSVATAALRQVLDVLSFRDAPGVYIEALHTLGAAAHSYPEDLVPWDDVFRAVSAVSVDPDPAVRVAIMRLFERATSAARGDSSKLLWQFLVPEFLGRAFSDGAPTVRSAAAAVLSNCADAAASGGMEVSELEWCKRTAVDTAHDTAPPVRASAWSALGDLVLCRTTDSQWVASVVVNSVDTGTRDSTLAVRVKASWALANAATLADRWLSPQQQQQADLERTVECLVCISKDHEKVRANAIRGLGNLASSVPFILHYGSDEGKARVDRISEALLAALSAADQPKVQWNACKAMGAVLCERSLVGTEPARRAFAGLLAQLSASKNFKIRIQAAQALSSLPERAVYGDSDAFCVVWAALVSALDRAFNSGDDLAAFKYKDVLCSALVIAVSKLAQLAQPAADHPLMLERMLPKALVVVHAFRDSLKHAATADAQQMQLGLATLRQILESDPVALLAEDTLRVIGAIDELMV